MPLYFSCKDELISFMFQHFTHLILIFTSTETEAQGRELLHIQLLSLTLCTQLQACNCPCLQRGPSSSCSLVFENYTCGCPQMEIPLLLQHRQGAPLAVGLAEGLLASAAFG